MPGQLNLSNIHVPQQSLPQFNFHNVTQLPNTHIPINFSPFPSRNVNRPPIIAPHHLVNSQVPVIPPSIAPQVPTLNERPRNPISPPPAHPIPCPTAPKLPLNLNPDLNLWRFPQNNPLKVNQITNNAAGYNKFQPTLLSSTANAAISQPISQSSAPQNLNRNHAATYCNQVNPFSTANNIDPPFFKPIIPPMYGHTAPAPLCWCGPLQPAPPAPAAKNANLIKALGDAITSKRNDPLPEWKLSQYSGDPLQWHEWYGQFKSAIDSQSLKGDVNLTYFKNLVTGKANTDIAEFAYCGAMYKDALKTLEIKFGQPQAVVSAHLDKLNSFPPLKMHNSDNITYYSRCISSLVGAFKSFS